MRLLAPRPRLRPGRMLLGCRPVCRWKSWEVYRIKEEKPYYVTTPIFYVNGAPHVGHLYTMVLSDVMKRWKRLQLKRAFLSTGTDEHGAKIQRVAAQEGLEPQQLCDHNAAKFKDLAGLANVDYDAFCRTTDARHKEAVRQFFGRLRHGQPEGMGLYKGVHKGWYCVSDECFYPESLVRSAIQPRTGNNIMVNDETGHEVEWVEEETWFFPLTKYKDALLKFYDENPDWIIPRARMKDVREWCATRIADLSITRPSSRLHWGIPDPEDGRQTIYVWVDALVNYITNAGYGDTWHRRDDDTGAWPADLHIIGKDILRFHAVYWPALLMALDLPLPKRILCHGHLTMSDRKMSKSLGNVVDPVFALQRWETDTLRYFLMRKARYSKDMKYSNKVIGTMYAKELQNSLGNLFYRVARPKDPQSWSTLEAVKSYRDGLLNLLAQHRTQTDGKAAVYYALEPFLNRVPDMYRADMDVAHVSEALGAIHMLLKETNRYVNVMEPWALATRRDRLSRMWVKWVIYSSADALRIAAILLQPFMPNKAAQMLDGLGVMRGRRTFDYARSGADLEFGTVAHPERSRVNRVNPLAMLFPPMPDMDATDAEVVAKLKLAVHSRTATRKRDLPDMLGMERRLGPGQVKNLLGSVEDEVANGPSDDSRVSMLEEVSSVERRGDSKGLTSGRRGDDEDCELVRAMSSKRRVD